LFNVVRYIVILNHHSVVITFFVDIIVLTVIALCPHPIISLKIEDRKFLVPISCERMLYYRLFCLSGVKTGSQLIVFDMQLIV